MSASRQYGERGGFADQQHATSDLYDFGAGHPASSTTTTSSSNTHATTEHDYRFPRRPAGGGPQQQQYREQSYFSTDNEDSYDIDPRGSGVEDRLDFSARPTGVARKEMLRETIFPTWKDGSGGAELDSPDEMQKKDPLATQIWRLYSKTKKQLPNQERMENLTWRMMAMSLRKRKQEEEAAAARYVFYRGFSSN
jgi:GATA-binding protein